MAQLTPEGESLLQLIIYLECKIDAITDILNNEGIHLSSEEIEAKTHRIHAVQGYPKRYRILGMMKSGKLTF